MEQAQQGPKDRPDAIHRYYHMFAKDELRRLVQLAVQEIGLEFDSPYSNEADTVKTAEGVEIVENGWERSNYYIELRRWQR
jgi:tRNA (uracil-5-)-methyltransferase TRM9